ncbi:hypothetical protein [Tabrizicola sp.]|uniref:hypothetical protein n=1 Tax=Tabrizicola sp. TaxID=2005166 RepID=UPI003F364792
MYCRHLAIAPALAVTSLASAGFAEPTVRECKEAAAAVAEMLNPKREINPKGIGWVLLPPALDYYSLVPAEQWRQVAMRLWNYPVFLLTGTDVHPPLTRKGKWSREAQPDEKRDYARGFTQLDTLEQCLRPSALATSPELKTEIADLDSRFPLEQRAALRPLMKASQ